MSAPDWSDELPEYGVWGDESTRNRIGRVRGPHGANEPVEEYEASGRFAAVSPPDMERVAAIAERIVANRESLKGSPATDQLEAAYRLAESCSPGHERLGCIGGSGRTAGEWFSSVVAGHRRPVRDPAQDVAQQVPTPLATTATMIGCTDEGGLHVRVTTPRELVQAARLFLPTQRKESWCGFCRRKKLKVSELKILLRGRSFWIDARPVCRRCRDELEASAGSVGIELTWVSGEAAAEHR
jgi:hypothetical protein